MARYPTSPVARAGADNAAAQRAYFGAAERRLNAYSAEFPTVGEEHLRLHSHPGVEILYVLQGTLQVRVAEEDHVLHAGDSIYFDSTIPHGYRGHAGDPCSAVVVTTAA